MPSPVVAQLGSTFHRWSFAMRSSWRTSDTSRGRRALCFVVSVGVVRGLLACLLEQKRGVNSDDDIPPRMSCLLAKTSSSASFISRSWMMRASSVRASSMRSRSLESMTNINPCVPVWRGLCVSSAALLLTCGKQTSYLRSSVSTAAGSCLVRPRPKR